MLMIKVATVQKSGTYVCVDSTSLRVDYVVVGFICILNITHASDRRVGARAGGRAGGGK